MRIIFAKLRYVLKLFWIFFQVKFSRLLHVFFYSFYRFEAIEKSDGSVIQIRSGAYVGTIQSANFANTNLFLGEENGKITQIETSLKREGHFIVEKVRLSGHFSEPLSIGISYRYNCVLSVPIE